MFDQIMNRQEEIRKGLFEVMRKKHLSVTLTAVDIGISPVTLQKFFKSQKVHYLVLMKIEDYLIEQNATR